MRGVMEVEEWEEFWEVLLRSAKERKKDVDWLKEEKVSFEMACAMMGRKS